MTDQHKKELNGFLKATVALRRRLRQKTEKEESDKSQSFDGNAYQRREAARASSKSVLLSPDQKEKKK